MVALFGASTDGLKLTDRMENMEQQMNRLQIQMLSLIQQRPNLLTAYTRWGRKVCPGRATKVFEGRNSFKNYYNETTSVK